MGYFKRSAVFLWFNNIHELFFSKELYPQVNDEIRWGKIGFISWKLILWLKKKANAFTSLTKRRVCLKHLFSVWHEYPAYWSDEAAFSSLRSSSSFTFSLPSSRQQGSWNLTVFMYVLLAQKAFQPRAGVPPLPSSAFIKGFIGLVKRGWFIYSSKCRMAGIGGLGWQQAKRYWNRFKMCYIN